ncbi:hypothetical protein ASPWEDRAFT_46512 [Aspergillus wentii DTO 134E9]|uniref:Zn(2)-C6 fungal-type domain-containing protein n=1 Tax=Aspergillus wentii DTO 134E9 TaxID=1073089 RepID=A0A1L9R4D9_ASPWE|nr:uncharacterized protein ASPWEDRAFT_46512 [Aspergillus wentii DTO 134E9]OJJ29764.1 hypothetical protein ASPWEDRAFT_46512 [Aspergillus wentii DTO 134E9]
MVVYDPEAALPTAKKKPINRQSRSCKVCRLRKVKCDRVKPCHACCAHGYPSKCVFEVIPDDEGPIIQADEIRNLRLEIRDLRSRIDSYDHRMRSRKRLAKLNGFFDSIRSAPLEVVDQLVGGIRNAHNNALKKQVVSVGPWEGSEDLPLRRQISQGDEDVEEVFIDDSDRSASFNFASPFEDSDDSSSSSSSLGPPISSARPALDLFVERFVDAFSPQVNHKHGRAGALRAAAGIRMFSPMISEAYEAVSMAFFGRSIGHKQLELTGFERNFRVLKGLQQALQDPERSKAESTLVTVILLMAFESVESTSSGSVAAHVHGALRLIEHRGPENHMYGVEHLLFTELRPYWVGAALITRSATFLNQEEWKTIPWSAGTTTKDLVHYLLDLAVEIPGILEEYDNLNAALSTTILSAHEKTVKQASLWNNVADVTLRFYEWKRVMVDNYPDGPPEEVPAGPEPNGNEGFPIFRCQNPRTGEIITPTKFSYPDLRLAQSMCVYCAFRLILSSADTRPEDRVGPLEQYGLACYICRSLEWYILTAPGNMINRLAFPVRVAWEGLPDGGPEQEFMVKVLKLVEQRHSLGLWGGKMREFSPRSGSPPGVASPPKEE